MYIRLMDAAPRRYTLAQLRADHPEISFPQAPSAELLAQFSVFPVIRAPSPAHDPLTQNLREGDIALQDGAWVQGWVVEQAAPEELAARLRATRDRRLSQSDWLVVKHIEQGQALPADWAAYRQALRDLPQQPGFPLEVVWPVAPDTDPTDQPG